MRLQEVLDSAKEKFRPKENDLMRLNDIAQKVIDFLRSKGFDARLGGSLAKGTLIAKKHQDIDIFVVFEDEKDVTRILNIKKIFGKNTQVVHGSRDYIRFEAGGVYVEIVPIVKIKNANIVSNVTDFSLWHIDYIKKMISKTPKLSDEIMLAKAFCVAQEVYGAESYIRGFSGYSLEVLVTYFKSFEGFLKKIKKGVIDPAKHFKNPKLALTEINASKLTGPLVVVDPTYKYRNITAGLSEQTFEEFLLASKNFLKNPDIWFFEKPLIDKNFIIETAKKNNANFYEVEIKTRKQPGNAGGAKMRKFFDFLDKELKRANQKVLFKKFFYDGKSNYSRGFFALKERRLIEIRGPPISMKEAVNSFSKKGKTFLKSGYVYKQLRTSFKKILEDSNNLGKEMGAWAKISSSKQFQKDMQERM